MRRDEERPRVQEQDLQAVRLAQAEDLLRAVATEHPSADNHRVELPSSVRGRLVPGVAHEPAQGVEAERGSLDVRRRGDRLPRIHQAIERHAKTPRTTA